MHNGNMFTSDYVEEGVLNVIKSAASIKTKKTIRNNSVIVYHILKNMFM